MVTKDFGHKPLRDLLKLCGGFYFLESTGGRDQYAVAYHAKDFLRLSPAMERSKVIH